MGFPHGKRLLLVWIGRRSVNAVVDLQFDKSQDSQRNGPDLALAKSGHCANCDV